ncbi:hypothetical protein N8T08_001777 [Aspergillus melleus]|uniref:Uncharacterized protein n=1 Tax=Aspergillus melleus TaxID=138277 RepID=A0ACC3AMY9_9EURO|nr:hypothetical protein N8T08_001777 [Aspergillus melleus]
MWRYRNVQNMIPELRKECNRIKRIYFNKSCVLHTVFAASGLKEKPLASILKIDPKNNLNLLNWALVRIEKWSTGTNMFRNLGNVRNNLIGFSRQDTIYGNSVILLD